MYILTGGAGFIGSNFLAHLNARGVNDIIVVDNLGSNEKWKNLVGKQFNEYWNKAEFLQRLENKRLPSGVKAIIHLGACSSTTEIDAEYMMQNNFRYSCAVAEWAEREKIRLIYASSAATYGDGSLGFLDTAEHSLNLRPLNVYGYSKQLFDMWALRRGFLSSAVGIKFFNVFGPNEYHKGNMCSVVFKAFHQIRDTGTMGLFRSYRPDYKDGEQRRDFIYVKDCCDVMFWFLENPHVSGLFNLGCGQSRSWNEMAKSIFQVLRKEPSINYIDMPGYMREKYQYFTEAPIGKLRAAGYAKEFTSLEAAIQDYLENYLMRSDPIL